MSTKQQKVVMGFDLDDPKQFAEFAAKLKDNIVNKKLSAKDALELPDDLMENVYAMAYELLNKGHPDQAKEMFAFIGGLDPANFKYIFGYAACSHQLKDYNEALRAYTITSALNPQNPLSAFYCADCFLNLGQPELAVNSLMTCIRLSSGHPEFKKLEDQAILLAEQISDTISL
ncbi:MAG: SycD/LcrH family type III secretion system chaperone [Parachlamydiales bacterium]|nr:SycD/LcrH family type III secretion system chaperone [Parachlamydiales bacterium]